MSPPGLLAVLARWLTRGTGGACGTGWLVILALAVCAVLAGARSFTAIAEWAADADSETLARLGVTGGAVGVDVPADLAAPGRGRLR